MCLSHRRCAPRLLQRECLYQVYPPSRSSGITLAQAATRAIRYTGAQRRPGSAAVHHTLGLRCLAARSHLHDGRRSRGRSSIDVTPRPCRGCVSLRIGRVLHSATNHRSCSDRAIAAELRQARLVLPPTVTITLEQSLASWIAMVRSGEPHGSAASRRLEAPRAKHVPDVISVPGSRRPLIDRPEARHRLGILRDAILRVAAACHQRINLVAELVFVAPAPSATLARDSSRQVAGRRARRIGAGRWATSDG